MPRGLLLLIVLLLVIVAAMFFFSSRVEQVPTHTIEVPVDGNAGAN